MSGWVDVTIPVRHGMVSWPGDPAPVVERVADMDSGADCNVSRIAMSVHTGTHMDAMLHFLKGGRGMETMPLDAVIGPARVIEIRDPALIRREEIEPYRFQRGERVLFKTANSRERWKTPEFHKDFIAVDPGAATFLVERGVQTVGVDYLSVAPFADGKTTHGILLNAGVWVIEGLYLADIEPGNYELICLPLKIEGSDGAPARAVLRRV